MGFTKLKDRIDQLPLVLAGPLVRRVEPKTATVWVALRRRRKVRLEIYDASGALVGKGDRETRAIGKNLHIVCVTAVALTSFSAGTTYEYNLFFDHVGAGDSIRNGANLFDTQIVSALTVSALAEDDARIKLTYANDGGPARPSFVLPPSSLADLRLLHGSCRKVSGPHADGLEAADAILRQEFKPNGRRPHMLFLTGDNIYNDGTERALFEVIVEAAPVLLGWDEEMAGSGSLSKKSSLRWGDALDGAGLTNPGRYYHLFGLGETIALYLLEFAEVLWPNDLDYQRRTFDFQGTLPAVRRALANIATYMIFDDHEFSNSWNLSADWVESVLVKDMGRRVYQNALVAYVLCQGWGNTPERFESGPGKELLDAVVDWSTAEIGGTSSPAQPLERIAKCTGVPDMNSFKLTRDWSKFHGQDVVRWDYNVPCPGLNIEVLDTYMWRSYPSNQGRSVILTKDALDRQLDPAPQNTECSLIVVSNVAIELPGMRDHWSVWDEFKWGLLSALVSLLFPVWVVIKVLQLLFGRFFPHGETSLPMAHSALRAKWPLYDDEYFVKYEAQTKGFELLMSHAIHRAPQQIVSGNRQGRVVFLSGDAHRSFCMRMDYWSRIPFGLTADPVEGVIAQLVGSPCKWVNPTVFKKVDTAEHHWAGWRDEPKLTWKTPPKESPWPFKDSPWMVEYKPAAKEPVMNPDPEWRYSLTVVEPNRNLQHVPLQIPDRPNPTLDDQLAEMKLVSNNVLTQIEKSQVVKVNNLADVSFNWTSNKKVVVQDVWWRARPAVDLNWTISRFEVPMDPPSTPPKLPTP